MDKEGDLMLENKVAIITGGTRGIGYATVLKFLENKATVIIFGSKEESVKKAIARVKEINKEYKVSGYYPNLTNEEDIKKTFQEIYEKYGQIDILVNNAGVTSSTPLLDYTSLEYDKIMNLNVKAMFLCSKLIVPYMKDKGGVILNTSSMVSIYGQAKGCIYPTSKSAVNGLTKSLARELGCYNIRVNAIAPGVIETDMVASLPKQVIEPIIKTIPLGRMGTPDDIASAFLFLASPYASYISGAILSVDGATIN